MLIGQLREEGLKKNISMVVVFVYCMTNCRLATSAVLFCLGLLLWSFSFCCVLFCFPSIFFFFTCIASVPVRILVARTSNLLRGLIFFFIFCLYSLFFIIFSISPQRKGCHHVRSYLSNKSRSFN